MPSRGADDDRRADADLRRDAVGHDRTDEVADVPDREDRPIVPALRSSWRTA